MVKDIVILDGVRTPMASFNGAFSDLSAIDLAAHASREALSRTGTDPSEIDHVIFGNAQQTSGDAIYGARHVGLKAGVPKEVPAVTVNRLCGSGFESIVQGAHRILLGEAETVLAGGMENMSQAPHVIRGARKGLRLGSGQLEDSLMVALLDTYSGLMMAQTSDRVARKYGITREQQDEYAYQSQKRAADAWSSCRLSEEVVPVEVKSGKKTIRVEKDEHLRPDTTLEGLAALPPSFGKDGMVTAGNASGIVDGAAAVVVTSAENAQAKGKRPLGRLISWGVVGCDPELMGIGPAPAARAALARAGMKPEQIDLWEINEAFAGQILGVVAELGLDRARLNVNGGAIALGHPLGASGTRCTLTLLKEMRRRGVRYGLAGACIGGGQGIAVVLENPEAGGGR
jgi:acetyl-CoA acetyltransferase family protein